MQKQFLNTKLYFMLHVFKGCLLECVCVCVCVWVCKWCKLQTGVCLHTHEPRTVC